MVPMILVLIAVAAVGLLCLLVCVVHLICVRSVDSKKTPAQPVTPPIRLEQLRYKLSQSDRIEAPPRSDPPIPHARLRDVLDANMASYSQTPNAERRSQFHAPPSQVVPKARGIPSQYAQLPVASPPPEASSYHRPHEYSDLPHALCSRSQFYQHDQPQQHEHQELQHYNHHEQEQKHCQHELTHNQHEHKSNLAYRQQFRAKQVLKPGAAIRLDMLVPRSCRHLVKRHTALQRALYRQRKSGLSSFYKAHDPSQLPHVARQLCTVQWSDLNAALTRRLGRDLYEGQPSPRTTPYTITVGSSDRDALRALRQATHSERSAWLPALEPFLEREGLAMASAAAHTSLWGSASGSEGGGEGLSGLMQSFTGRFGGWWAGAVGDRSGEKESSKDETKTTGGDLQWSHSPRHRRSQSEHHRSGVVVGAAHRPDRHHHPPHYQREQERERGQSVAMSMALAPLEQTVTQTPPPPQPTAPAQSLVPRVLQPTPAPTRTHTGSHTRILQPPILTHTPASAAHTRARARGLAGLPLAAAPAPHAATAASKFRLQQLRLELRQREPRAGHVTGQPQSVQQLQQLQQQQGAASRRPPPQQLPLSPPPVSHLGFPVRKGGRITAYVESPARHILENDGGAAGNYNNTASSPVA